MNDKNIILLPSGLQDILPDEAGSESKLVINLLKNFSKFGYLQVKPPLMEFEKSLVKGSGKYLENQIFKVMDPISQEMMGVRTDMTIQVARLASLRMTQEPKPLRLSYAGQVLRVQGEGLYKERQLSQAGIEMIGDASSLSVAESVIIAVDSLKKLNVKDISVDFSLSILSEIIMDSADTPLDLRKRILSLVEVKDAASIELISDKSSLIFVDIINLANKNSSLGAEKILDELAQIIINNGLIEAVKYIDSLKEIIAIVEKSQSDITITIDPLERHGFEYHKGVSFSFFSKNSKEELGRGGKYITDFEDIREDAVGFTLSVNALKRMLPEAKAKNRVYIPIGVSMSETEKLREENYATIHAICAGGADKARELNCNYIYANGEVKPL